MSPTASAALLFMDEMTTSETKKALRAEARQRRDAGAGDGAHAAQALAGYAARVRALTAAQDPVVTSYLAIGSELDPGPLAAALATLGATIALPVMAAKAAPLEFRAWTPGDPLVAREWGIREPAPDAPVVEPDILLVPLLAVDRCGYRLGYGGGFYDRTLARLRARRPVLAIGLAYPLQVVDAVPREVYDEPLDHLLTPTGFEPLLN